MTTEKQEYVLCAAIKRKIHINVGSKNYKTSTLDDDDIYSIEIGRRHNDIICRFVNREEALKIAKDVGQIKDTVSNRLFSEDLCYKNY